MKASEKSSHDDEPVIAFMPIKPVYAERILSGEKHFEFRRTRIRSDLTHIVIYSSHPVKRVVGSAEVLSVKEGSPTKVWDTTKDAAGISRQAFRAYFAGAKSAIAILLGKVSPLDLAVCPTQVADGFTVPQSFRYIDKDFLNKVTELGSNELSEAV